MIIHMNIILACDPWFKSTRAAAGSLLLTITTPATYDLVM